MEFDPEVLCRRKPFEDRGDRLRPTVGRPDEHCAMDRSHDGVRPLEDRLALEHELREKVLPRTKHGETLWGISALPAHGLMVRCVALHGRHVLPGLQALWQTAKRRLYGRDAVPPRKVN